MTIPAEGPKRRGGRNNNGIAPPSGGVNFRLTGDADDLQWLYAEAHRLGMSVNQYLQQLVSAARRAGMTIADHQAYEAAMVAEARRAVRTMEKVAAQLRKVIEMETPTP